MKSLAVALGALCLVSVSASAAASQLDSPANGDGREATAPAERSGNGEAEDGADDERQICRRIETNTGSRVPFRRVCMSEREWRAYNRQN